MSLRLVEIVLPLEREPAARDVLASTRVAGSWSLPLPGGQALVRIVLDAEASGALVDAVERRFADTDGFRMLILPVEAALPRMAAPPHSTATPPSARGPARVSREELQTRMLDMSNLSGMFVASVLLSGVVAAVGLARDSVAVVIGAMVIAPLLGPNMALAFAATIGDVRLLRRALFTSLVGFVLALGLGVIVGRLAAIDPLAPEIAARTAVHPSDMILALAAGCAGALALTTGMSVVLVGVMVAVALLPPTVTLGMMLGDARWDEAHGAWLLVATNLLGVNLAGMLTFVGHGLRPNGWWEPARARRSSRLALVTWLALLAALGSSVALLGPHAP